MSNVGQAVLSIGGAIIGGLIGGPAGAFRGFYLGYVAGSVAFPTELPPIRGPRLEDLKAQTSQIGNPIALVAGTFAVAGNVIWASDLIETKHKDTAGGKGGPSQKTVSYTYSQSFAILLAESVPGTVFQIQGIRRIWANGKLIYDRTPQGDDEEDEAFTRRLAASDLLDTIMEFYDGSQTTADPTIEMDKGVGNVPAYMDESFVVFTEMQLNDYGNRAPMLVFELYTNGSASTVSGVYSNEVLYPWRDGAIYFDSRDSRNDHTYTIEGEAYIDDFATAASTYCGLRTETYAFSSVGVGGSTIFSGSPNLPDYSGDPVITYAYLNLPGIPTDQRYFNTSAPSGDNGNVPWWASQIDPDGGHDSPYYSAIFQIYGALGSTVWTPVPRSSGGLAAPPNSFFDYWVDSELWMKRVPTAPPDPVDVLGAIAVPGSSTAFLIDGVLTLAQSWEYDDTGTYKVLAPYAQSDTIDVNANVTQYPLNPCLRDDDANYSDEDYWTAAYDAAVVSGDMAPGLTYGVEYPTVQGWAYVNANGSGVIEVAPVSVGDIVAALCERAGLSSSQYDTSDLEAEVDGYAVGSLMSARDAIVPLSIFGMFNSFEADQKLYFVERGGAVVKTLSADELAAHPLGGERPAAVQIQRKQDIELPAVLRVKYASPSRDYEPGTQPATRETTSTNAIEIVLPINMSDTTALQLAEALMFDAWAARDGYSFCLDYSNVGLTPTDRLELPVDGQLETVRILASDSAILGCIKIDALRDDADVLTSYASRDPDSSGTGSTKPELPLPGPTELLLLDIPRLRAEDNDAGYYSAGRGYLPGWSGYAIARSFDGGTDYTTVASMSDTATMATLTAEFTGSSTELTLTAESGSFSDATEAQLDAGANILAVGTQDDGWELLQFEDAVLSTGVWTLSGLRRGIRGTSAFATIREAGDRAVLMTGGGILRIPLPASQVGVEHLIKPVSIGNRVADTTAVPFTSTGLSLQGGGLGYDDDDGVIIEEPPPAGAITVVSATTTDPPEAQSFDSTLFGHWVRHQLGNDDASDFTAAFSAAPSLKCAVMNVYWSEVEPTSGAFDFTVPLSRLATCAAASKYFAILFMDLSYTNDSSLGAAMLPSDLAGDTRYCRTTTRSGHVSIRWNPVVAGRLRALWDAWISAVNSSGNAAWFAGIASQETAHGLSSADLTDTGYTASKYAQVYIENARHLQSAMPGKYYLFFTNHFTGGRDWIDTIINTCAPLGNFMAGGPDDWWTSSQGGGLRSDFYPRLLNHKDQCPIFIGMSPPSYDEQPQVIGGAVPPYASMLSGAKYARDRIGARVIIWMRSSSAGNDFDPDGVDVIESTMPTFNGTTDWQQPTGVWYVPPTGATGAWADDGDEVHGGQLALPDGAGGWTFRSIPPGSLIYASDTGQTFYTSDGTSLDDGLFNPIYREIFGP